MREIEMHVEAIIEVKKSLEDLVGKDLISSWELPYENLLTRLNAAIFFIEFNESNKETVTETLNAFGHSYISKNIDKKLSDLAWRLQIGKTEEEIEEWKEKYESVVEEA